MIDSQASIKLKPVPSVELVEGPLSHGDMQDLCDATDAAIEAGGGFGWIKLPNREILERFWQGVIVMPHRRLFVARLDGVICGTAQLILPAKNNESQDFAVELTSLFIAPWAREQGLSRRLLDFVERVSLKEGFSVINLSVKETQEAAIALYESSGYKLIGEHPCYARVGGKVVRGRYYYRVLDPSILGTSSRE
jgi:ribosomal protein S18 acetylase RimI-like enzyme